jgi:hypothetical protein
MIIVIIFKKYSASGTPLIMMPMSDLFCSRCCTCSFDGKGCNRSTPGELPRGAWKVDSYSPPSLTLHPNRFVPSAYGYMNLSLKSNDWGRQPPDFLLVHIMYVSSLILLARPGDVHYTKNWQSLFIRMVTVTWIWALLLFFISASVLEDWIASGPIATGSLVSLVADLHE